MKCLGIIWLWILVSLLNILLAVKLSESQDDLKLGFTIDYWLVTIVKLDFTFSLVTVLTLGSSYTLISGLSLYFLTETQINIDEDHTQINIDVEGHQYVCHITVPETGSYCPANDIVNLNMWKKCTQQKSYTCIYMYVIHR